MARILVVDDEEQIALSVARLLRRAGFDVCVATSGRAALELLEGVDVLLTDVRMPVMTGIELALEAKRRSPEIICCLMSGDGSAAQRAGRADPAITGRLDKPFDLSELLALIRRGLSERIRAKGA